MIWQLSQECGNDDGKIWQTIELKAIENKKENPF